MKFEEACDLSYTAVVDVARKAGVKLVSEVQQVPDSQVTYRGGVRKRAGSAARGRGGGARGRGERRGVRGAEDAHGRQDGRGRYVRLVWRFGGARDLFQGSAAPRRTQ